VRSQDWEEYRGAGSRNPLAPRVTIIRYSQIHLNRAAYELLGCPAQVLLLYDARHRRIGLRAAPEASPYSHRVKQQTATRSTYAVLGSRPFIRHYGLECGRLIEFSHIQMEDDIMMLDLDQARRKGMPRAGLRVFEHPEG
jgi:hypothetical protein